ncbi:hypothetical protein D7X30_34160 [Corallococcus sp. AB011P]|uniref:SpvB/TcaC N-terminal domain-containing protein n=1 Tax=Corallococcus sp. AB011P TaxID=2316735 RepID=UPI000EA2F3A0|nr:SpvB/TcaC N-terminal domain-containing protein [Corallococcus sp. AB011P]RKG52236.1 hypothetical protein D7X30_34160 [Corallococcus sp. AB011P]
MAERRTREDSRQGQTPIRASVPTAPTLSLPKGGGALRGIGEKYSTNLATGTATLAVPITTSPGRSGFNLHLELGYNSGAGNGPFGIGWHCSVSAITRKTDKGLPRYLDAEESDVFVLSSAEDLVPIHSPPIPPRDGCHIQRYRPRVEGPFARIERWTNETTGDVHWRILTRDNVQSIYGRSAGARIADPASPDARVFSWLLEETRDDRGNVARYTYKPEDGAGVDPAKTSEANRFERNPGEAFRLLPMAQRYLKRIQYGNRAPLAVNEPAPADPSAWLFEVVFDYGEHDRAAPTPDDAQATPWSLRPDPFSVHRAGFEVRTYRLCRRVLMFHRFAELGETPCLVRSTDFTYDESPVLSYLTKVEQAGYTRNQMASSYTRAMLPPLELDYARLTKLHDTVQLVDRASCDGLPAGVDGVTAQWVDLDGEGIPGVLQAYERGWYYKANLGGGRLAPPALLRSLPSPAELRGGFQHLTDIQGDGQLDLVRYAPPLSGYFARTKEGSWQPFTAFRAVPNIDWGDANIRTVDLDGDGHPDVLITEHDAFVWYRSLAEKGFEPALRVSKPWDEEKGPAVVFADGTDSVHLADMSGDGLADLVRVRNGEICYWPNLGYGRFGPKVTMDRSPCFDSPNHFDPKRIRFADVDGSGTTDILYVGRDGVAIFLNQSGNGFSQPQVIDTLPVVDTFSSLTVTDLLGRGTACLVWSSSGPGVVSHPLRYVDLTGGEKPHVLVSSKNNLGAETRITYAPSTRFYLADKAAGEPWVTRLPFPIHVVERVETFDRISRNHFVTRYAYHHGYYDGVEREFRGFGRVEQWDTEELRALTANGVFPAGDNIDAASYVPPVLTKTWFHAGAFFEDDRISRCYEDEYYREPGLTTAQFRAMLLNITVLPGGSAADDMREACRALKGSILRQEVYAFDGTEAAHRPYRVSERNYTVVPVQPRGKERHGVFFIHPREAIEFHYERKLYDVGVDRIADPRVTHVFTLDVDTYGNVLRSVAIGYGRRHADPAPELTDEDSKQQKTLRITWTENTTTNAVEQEQAYRAPLVADSRTYEISKLNPVSNLAGVTNLFRFDEMASAVDGLQHGYDLAYEDLAGAGTTTAHAYRRLIERTRTFYRKDDLSGPLPLGHLESRALPDRVEQLALTPGLVASTYGDRVTDSMLTRGGYVEDAVNPGWWIPSGRVFYSPHDNDTATAELDYAKKHFFMACRFVDPFGKTTKVTYDPYDLLIVQTRDPAGNLVTVGVHAPAGALIENGNDYRVLQPARVMNPNRNRAAVAFDALGMVVGTAVMGKPEEHLGDSLAGFLPDLPGDVIAAHVTDPLAAPHGILQRATTRLVYDLFAYQRTASDSEPQAAVVYTLERETHDADLLPGQQTQIQHSFSYSDGFGREIQKKLQAEPGPISPGGPTVSPRWVGSGWTIFNNKGKPVRKYEPFFSNTHRSEFGTVHGVSSIVFYDPFERVVATLHPNHTYEKIVFDAWKQDTWDVNDTVLQADPRADPDVGDFFQRLPLEQYLPTWHDRRKNGSLGAEEKAAADKAAAHAGTPTVAYLDALGRPFLTVAHNRAQQNGISVEEMYATRMVLDIEGNQREVIDAKARVAMRYEYNLLGSRIHQASMEAGERWTLNDVEGKPLRAWDSRGHAFRTEYDELRRPEGSFVTGADPDHPSRESQYEKIEYGEGQPDDVGLNLRTRVLRHHDGAGVVTNMGHDPAKGRDEAYDFKGNLLRTERQFAVDYKRTLDWSNEVALEAEAFASSTRYDALNRPVELRTPDESRILPTYNEARLLERIEAKLRGGDTLTTFVDNLDYNAKGQRTLIEYGNGARTGLTYDPETFQLVHLVTTRGGGADVLQDLAYTFDPTGNITHIRDSAQQTTYFANAVVEPAWEYTYDAVYRLVEATGREHLGQVGGIPVPTSDSDAPRVGLQHPNDRSAMGLYRERYRYDEVGNILELMHRGTSPQNTGWTRSYNYNEPSLLEQVTSSNRLSSTEVGDAPKLVYTHDEHGNMVTMPHLPVMQWDCRDRLQASSRQAVQSGGTQEMTYYIYDAAGQRVRKVTERQAGPGQTPTRSKERNYLGALDIYREYAGDGETLTLERETLAVSDDERRIALVETRTDDGSASLVRYQLGNHLGSISLELDGSEAARIISYEEYYPFGGTAYHGVRSQTEAPKRYRYSGKERDEESGLYDHGARYYAPSIGRWTSADPLWRGDLYVYVLNNPIGLHDPDGAEESSVSTRLWGGVRALGGALQMVGGAAVFVQIEVPVAAQVAGGVAMVHGYSDWEVGWRQVFSGRNERSAVEHLATGAAQLVTEDKQKAEAFGTAVDVTLGFVNPAGPAAGGPRLGVALSTTGHLVPAVVETTPRFAQAVQGVRAGSALAHAGSTVHMMSNAGDKGDGGSSKPPPPSGKKPPARQPAEGPPKPSRQKAASAPVAAAGRLAKELGGTTPIPKGTNLALGLSETLDKFSASQGAVSVFGAWDKGFLRIPFLAQREVFMSKFATIVDTFIENGGRIKFDLTGLDPAIKGGVTEWELLQILGTKRWEAATDFFRQGERLTGAALEEALKPWR